MLFLAILLGFFVVNLIKSDQDTSELENRSLSQRPKLTWESITSGTFMERFESYVSDQFVGRNVFREIYVGFSRFGGSREENDVLRGRHRQLMETISIPDEELLAEDVAGINEYALSYPDVSTHILLVPDSAEILSNRIPLFASVADQAELFDNFRAQLDDSIIWADAVSVLEEHTDEKLYYQTDPHWTTQGAYDVFLGTAGSLGIEDPYDTTYDSYCAAYDFNGTLSSTSGFLINRKEEVDVYLPENATSYLVTYVEEAEKTTSIYSTDALDTRDKYAVFMGGNHSLVEIDTGGGQLQHAPCRKRFLRELFHSVFDPSLQPDHCG